ncbi:MAG: sensor histidine kinase, partial [Brevundimonas sp.]
MLRSLRWRLFLGGAAAMLAAVVVAWLFMGLLFTRHLERRLADEMERDGVRLVAALAATDGQPPNLQAALSDPRLSTPASGFYWQVRGVGRDDRSRSLWDQDIDVATNAPSDGWHLHT